MRNNVLFLLPLVALMISCGPSQEERLSARIQGLKEMAELGTVEYTVKKIVKTEDNAWYTYGDRKILFTCTAFIKAGIDMKDFKGEDAVTVKPEEKSISVTLPKAKVLSFNMPPEEIKQEYAIISGFRGKFTPEERQQLLVLAENDVREDITNMGIIVSLRLKTT